MRSHPQNKREFRARVQEWAAKLDVKVVRLYVRPMQHKWGSCSTKGTLSFNSELLDLDPELADYVIVHELLHVSAPNHGRVWKMRMRAHLGDHERLAGRLPKRANKKKMRDGVAVG